MAQLFAIAAGVTLAVAIVIGAGFLTYTAILIIAGIGIGYIIRGNIAREELEKQLRREEWRQENAHQRMLELLRAGHEVNWPPTINQNVPRIGRR